MLVIDYRILLNLVSFIWVFFWGLNFLGQSLQLNMLGIIPVLLLLLYIKKTTWEYIKKVTLIFCFTSLYTIIISEHKLLSQPELLNLCFSPIVFFTVGYYLVILNKHDSHSKLITKFLLLIAISYFLYGALNFTYQLLILKKSIVTRELVDIWGNIFITNTNQGSKFTLMGGLLPWIIVNRKPLRFKIIFMTLSLISLGATIALGNRTLLLIVLFNMILISIYFSKQRYNNRGNNFLKRYIIIVLLLVIVLQLNIFRIKDIYQESLLYKRSQLKSYDSIIENSRFHAWGKAFLGIFENPMGGYKTDIGLNYAHNLWLDIGYAAGLIPFILFVLITLVFMMDMRKIIKSRLDLDTKVLIYTVSISLVLNFMVEPIIEGYFNLFLTFFILLGIITAYRTQMRNVQLTGG